MLLKKTYSPFSLLLIHFVLFILAFFGCATPFYKNLKEVERKILTSRDIEPVFGDSVKKALYKSSVEAYGNNVSGMLLMKVMEDVGKKQDQKNRTTRFVLMSETGLTMFDLEFKNGEMRVIKCLEQFNKEIVLQTLKSDFELLLCTNIYTDSAFVLKDVIAGTKVFRFGKNNESDYYFPDPSGINVLKIVKVSGTKVKSEIYFKLTNNKEISFNKFFLPYEITIIHNDLDLKIVMKLLKNIEEENDEN